jgi:hypothetical protein
MRSALCVVNLIMAFACLTSDSVRGAPAAAAKPTGVTIPLGAGDDAVGMSIVPGSPRAQIVLEFADGGKRVLTLDVHGQTIRRRRGQLSTFPPAAERL